MHATSPTSDKQLVTSDHAQTINVKIIWCIIPDFHLAIAHLPDCGFGDIRNIYIAFSINGRVVQKHSTLGIIFLCHLTSGCVDLDQLINI